MLMHWWLYWRLMYRLQRRNRVQQETSWLKRLLVLTGLLCAGSCAQADPGYKYGVVFGFGYTFGGSSLGSLHYTDGQTQPFKLGGTYLVKVGEEWRLTNYPVDLQATLGYHLEQDHSDNSDVTFSRFPLEWMAYWRLPEGWRVGAGLRYQVAGKFHQSIAGTDYPSGKFANKFGYTIETEYFFFKSASVAVRYVVQPLEMTYEGSMYKVSGNHMGALVNLYF